MDTRLRKLELSQETLRDLTEPAMSLCSGGNGPLTGSLDPTPCQTPITCFAPTC